MSVAKELAKEAKKKVYAANGTVNCANWATINVRCCKCTSKGLTFV